jgi:hypothetical protein
MTTQSKNILKSVLILAICFSVGFFIGYLVFSKDEPAVRRIVEIKWQKGEMVRDTVDRPVPVETIIRDSIPVPIPTDTAALFAVWKDYCLERKYALNFSNDSIGTFQVDAVVNQNKLISATSLIQPNIRTVYEKEVIYKKEKWVPWAMIGTSVDLKTNKVQFGVDLNQKYVIGVSGIRMDNRYRYTLDFGIKFK